MSRNFDFSQAANKGITILPDLTTVTPNVGDVVSVKASVPGQVLLTFQSPGGAGAFLPLSGGTLTGPLILAADPTAIMHAATKQYVDGKAGTSGVSTFNSRNGAVTLNNTDVTTALTYTPYNASNPSGYQTAAQVTTALTPYALLAAPVFTGDARAVTPTVGDNDTSIATTAFVQAAVAPYAHNVGRNLCHNSLFSVAQRGAGPWTAAGYTTDRWSINFSLDTVSATQVTLPDAYRTAVGDEAIAVAHQTTVTGNAGAAAFTLIAQPIEDVRRLGGKTVTVSFWAWSAAGTPKVGISVDQQFGAGGSPSAPVNGAGQAITISNTPVRYTLSFTLPSTIGKTIGTTANSSFTLLNFWYSSGANQATRAGNIGVQSGTISLWGVQLEVGSVATPLEKPDPQQDLAKCQRFYQTATFQLGAYNTAGGACQAIFQFPVVMRAPPTITPSGGGSSNVTAPQVAPQGNAGYQVTYTATATGSTSYFGAYTASADL